MKIRSILSFALLSSTQAFDFGLRAHKPRALDTKKAAKSRRELEERADFGQPRVEKRATAKRYESNQTERELTWAAGLQLHTIYEYPS